MLMQHMTPSEGVPESRQARPGIHARLRNETDFAYVGSGRPRRKHAIVTLICSESWVPGALALAASLRAHGTTADRVLLISEHVPSKYWQALELNFEVIRLKPEIFPHPSITRVGGECVTMQLHTWGLPYKKALYMDADMIVLKNPDDLLEHSQIAAKVDFENDQQLGFNGGMFVCEPNIATYKKLVKHLQTWKPKTPHPRKGMQQFLNHMFPPCNKTSDEVEVLVRDEDFPQAGCWSANLSSTHNKFSRELLFEEPRAMLSGEHKLYSSIHFSGNWEADNKPWMRGCLMPSSSTTKVMGHAHGDILDLWMNAYRDVKRPTLLDELLKVDCPYFDCVTPQKELDFFIYTTKMDCVLRDAIARLLLYASPRRLFLIAPGPFCRQAHVEVQFRGVTCLERDALIPGLSYKLVEEFIRQKSRTWKDESFNWTEVDSKRATDEYMGRLLKFGIARMSKKLDLSEHYVILDPEVILIRDFCPFNKKGQVNFMQKQVTRDFYAQFDSRSEGQANYNKIYMSFFKMVSGLAYAHGESMHGSFESYHAVVNTNSMNRFLDAVETRASRKAGARYWNEILNTSLPVNWASAMLNIACRSGWACWCGFSEYGSYASWMKHDRPQDFAELLPLYRKMRPTNWSQPAPCCPVSYDLSGINGLGEGHQFVHFNRECTPPDNTTVDENMYWFHRTERASRRESLQRKAAHKHWKPETRRSGKYQPLRRR